MESAVVHPVSSISVYQSYMYPFSTIHLIGSVFYQTAEALFNLVLGWTVMFAPLLFTDEKKDRFKGPLELWWILQMFLTNSE